MSYQAETGRASAGIGGLVRLLIVIAATLAGFLAASSFEHCGPRLLSMAIGVGLVAPAAGARLPRASCISMRSAPSSSSSSPRCLFSWLGR